MFYAVQINLNFIPAPFIYYINAKFRNTQPNFWISIFFPYKNLKGSMENIIVYNLACAISLHLPCLYIEYNVTVYITNKHLPRCSPYGTVPPYQSHTSEVRLQPSHMQKQNIQVPYNEKQNPQNVALTKINELQ